MQIKNTNINFDGNIIINDDENGVEIKTTLRIKPQDDKAKYPMLAKAFLAGMNNVIFDQMEKKRKVEVIEDGIKEVAKVKVAVANKYQQEYNQLLHQYTTQRIKEIIKMNEDPTGYSPVYLHVPGKDIFVTSWPNTVEVLSKYLKVAPKQKIHNILGGPYAMRIMLKMIEDSGNNPDEFAVTATATDYKTIQKLQGLRRKAGIK